MVRASLLGVRALGARALLIGVRAIIGGRFGRKQKKKQSIT